MKSAKTKKYYTYIHTKPNNEVFYVGKGCGKRAYSKVSRNNHWHNIVNKHRYNVTIIDYYDSSKVSGDSETAMIAEYRSLGCELVNQTDGGDGGSAGRVWSEETLEKMSDRVTGENNPMFGKHHSEEVKKIISDANTGAGNFFYGKKHTKTSRAKMKAGAKNRKPISKETRDKLKIANGGKNNGMFGKKQSNETKEKIREMAKLRIRS